MVQDAISAWNMVCRRHYRFVVSHILNAQTKRSSQGTAIACSFSKLVISEEASAAKGCGTHHVDCSCQLTMCVCELVAPELAMYRGLRPCRFVCHGACRRRLDFCSFANRVCSVHFDLCKTDMMLCRLSTLPCLYHVDNCHQVK